MITYSLYNRKKQNLYEYFYDCIKADIVNGILKPGEKLPSKRAFATNHGVSIITVETAYGQLMAEGYIYSRPKSGFYVSHIESQIQSVSHRSDLIGSSSSDSSQIRYNLISNHTRAENFPFPLWAKLTRQVLTQRESELLTAPPTGGIYELRSAIARHLLDFRGIKCDPEQIIIGAGTEYLYGLIVQLLGQNLIYGLENPGSKKIKNIYQSLGVKVLPLSMDAEGIKLTPDNLTLPDIIQLSPSHHFPTGTVTSVSRRYGLLQWANETPARYIIEDDYDSEFRLQGKPIPSLFSMDATDRVIYFNTFTKSLASTIRISYMVLPLPLLKQFNEKLGFYSCTVSNFEQYTLAAFIREQHFEKHISRMRNQYRINRDLLIDLILKSELGKHVQITGENAGLHFLLHIETGESDAVLKKRAAEKGLLLAFLSDYYSREYSVPDSGYQHIALINYSGLAASDMEGVAAALCESFTF